jgi:hypothetical protein
MHNWFKISHRQHSGRLRPHEYTSYPALFVLLLVVGFALTVCSVAASTPYNGPESGSVGLSGVMPGKPPQNAPVIKAPTDGQVVSTSPVTVSGTCDKGTLVEVFKNDIFAGSGPCKDDSTFSFDVDLLIGKNKLIARLYNALNEPGPDSVAANVNYNVSPPQAASLAPLNFSGAQLLLNTDAVYRGTFPEQNMTVPIDIIGGAAPYAVNVQWGDASNKIVPRDNNLTFNLTHAYSKPGTYQITLQATDSEDRVAFLTVAAIVNGQPSAAAALGGAAGGKAASSKLLVLWPLYTTAAAMVFSFWYGERREKHILGGGPHYHSV